MTRASPQCWRPDQGPSRRSLVAGSARSKSQNLRTTAARGPQPDVIRPGAQFANNASPTVERGGVTACGVAVKKWSALQSIALIAADLSPI